MLKLSIITLNLNNGSGVDQTLQSILIQSFEHYEIIIVDGGSTDSSIDIIAQYQEKFISKKIPFIWNSEPDKGIYHAMNKGIRQAKGEYCFFLNSGDWLYNEDTLQNVYKTNPDSDIVFGNLKVVYPDNNVETLYGKKTITFMDLFLSNVVKHQSSFIKTQIFQKHGYYNENHKIVADWEFFMIVLGFEGASYSYLDQNIAYFDNNGISNHSNEICKMERESVLKKYIPPLILSDYEKWSKLKYLTPALQYRWSTIMLRIISKISKEISKQFRKA